MADNGVWLATTEEHHFEVFGRHNRNT
jgi:hypothetical protein